MATKPSTLPRIWADAGVYATGPFIGSISNADPGAGIASEGHRPGAILATAAEHENYQQLWQTTWIVDWLALGSSAGAANAHILETDSVGRFSAVGATFVDAVDETVLDITGANSLLPAVFVHSSATSFQADMANDPGVGFSAPIGTGDGLGFTSTMTGTIAGGAGVSVTANATTAGDGIVVTHAGSGTGAKFTATGTGLALDVIGSAAALYGGRFVGGSLASVLGEGVGAGVGGFFLSSSTAGATGLAVTLANNTGRGITIATGGGATSAARGIRSSVSGSAVAGEFVSPANYAAIFTGDTSSPTFGQLFITECDARPTTINTGQIARVRLGGGAVASQTMESCFEDFGVGVGEGWRGFLSTTGGSALGQAYSAGPVSAVAVGTWHSALSMSAGSGNAPKTAGRQVLMRVTFSWRVTPIASDATLGLRIIDVTADPGALSPVFVRSGIGSGAASGYLLPNITTSNWSVPMTIFCPVTVPAAGGRTWRLDVQTAGPGNITIRDISMDFLGML